MKKNINGIDLSPELRITKCAKLIYFYCRHHSSPLGCVIHRQALGPKPFYTLTPEEAIKQPTPADAVAALLKAQGKDPEMLKKQMDVTTQDLTYPGVVGDQIPARIYTPSGVTKDKLPVILYIHGGVWVFADIDIYHASPHAIAKKAHAIVVSVHYRQAPENKFPASHDDANAAYKWVIANADKWGADAKKIAVVGESAGGNLAITVAISARDEKLTQPVHIVAIYPVAGTNLDTASYKKNEDAKPLGKAGMAWFFKHEASSQSDLNDPRLNLVEAADLKGLPPVTIVTDEIDPLMSEGQMLAKKLEYVGVKTKLKNYNGVTHEFFGMGAVISKANDAEDFVAEELKQSFGNKTSQN